MSELTRKGLKNKHLTSLLFKILILALLLLTVFWVYQDGPRLTITRNIDQKQEILALIQSQYLGDIPSKEAQKQGELKGLVGSLNDPYSEYLPQADTQKLQDALNERYEGIGVQFNTKGEDIIVQRVFSNSPAKQAGIMRGDVLVKVDGEDVAGVALTKVAAKVRGPKDTTVSVTMKRGSEVKTFEVVRSALNTDLVYLDIYGDTAVVTISSFGDTVNTKMQEIAQQIVTNKAIKRVLIDVRGNTGGLLEQSVDVASYFVAPGTVVVQEKSKTETITDVGKSKNPTLIDYKVDVLVDESTASASEILAGALRDSRSARLVGQKTFGKGVVQKIFSLSNGDSLKLTVAEWLTPKGQRIHETGLEPDVVVKDNQDALDVALELK